VQLGRSSSLSCGRPRLSVGPWMGAPAPSTRSTHGEAPSRADLESGLGRTPPQDGVGHFPSSRAVHQRGCSQRRHRPLTAGTRVVGPGPIRLRSAWPSGPGVSAQLVDAAPPPCRSGSLIWCSAALNDRLDVTRLIVSVAERRTGRRPATNPRPDGMGTHATRASAAATPSGRLCTCPRSGGPPCPHPVPAPSPHRSTA
jgi:hypothetical protein